MSDPANALHRIATKFDQASKLVHTGIAATDQGDFAKALLQTAGLCVRACVDLDLVHETMTPLPEGDLGTDPWKLSVTNGEITVPTPVASVPIAEITDTPADVPDWAGGSNLHAAMSANADVTGGPQSAEPVSNN
jgi:hypothetical protein